MTRALIVETYSQLESCTQPFASCFEPLLAALDASCVAGHRAARIPAVAEYLGVCRWPFRQMEYSFVLEQLETVEGCNLKILDVGCGATILPHVLARGSHQVDACDYDADLIDALRRDGLCDLLSTSVGYSRQDATQLDFDSDTYDVVTCVSVLEHIPAPADQHAVCEMLRVLKPGGTLLLTIDFAPGADKKAGRLLHYVRRAGMLLKTEGFAALRSAAVRKREAAQVCSTEGAAVPRSANQPFDWRHLERDLLPAMRDQGAISVSDATSDIDPRTVGRSAVRRFWDLEPGLFDRQGRRLVIPVALAVRKRR